jgi:hypothetical protein
MAPYPSYTLTIADGVSPVAIGRPKRYQLCLHCVIFVFVHAACVAPFPLSFPERICFPSRVSAQCGSIERARGSSYLSCCGGWLIIWLVFYRWRAIIPSPSSTPLSLQQPCGGPCISRPAARGHCCNRNI